MEYKKTYINGCWVDGNSDKELKAVNPSNGEVIAVIKENNLDDVKSAVDSAKNAFYVTRQWRDMSAQERADILLKIADEVEKQAEEIAKIESMDNGKPLREAEADVDDAVHCFRYYEKPYDYAEFKKSVVEALEYTTPKKAKDFYYYKDDGVIYSIKTKNIVYFQTNNRITYIQCKNGKVMPTPYKSNKKILLELNSKKFLRCSNNTIVNAEYIEGIDKSNRYVMLVDGFGTLEIGPKLKKKFLEDFFKC